jgi:hypothetical protein
MHPLVSKEKRGPRKLSRLITRLPKRLAKNEFLSRHHPHPTMFKRVDRRRKRKEKEERLGLDEDQLGVFGLHHTDSSESESDSSDSASTGTSSSDGLATQSRKKRKREVSPPSYDEDSEDEESDSEPATDDEEDEGNNDHGSHPPLTIASALKEPIRPDSDSEEWVCAFCPGKTLKHVAMVKVHEASRVRIDYNQRRYLH